MAAQAKQKHAISRPSAMLLGSNPQGLSLEFEKTMHWYQVKC